MVTGGDDLGVCLRYRCGAVIMEALDQGSCPMIEGRISRVLPGFDCLDADRDPRVGRKGGYERAT